MEHLGITMKTIRNSLLMTNTHFFHSDTGVLNGSVLTFPAVPSASPETSDYID
jgi:hypothetical protein